MTATTGSGEFTYRVEPGWGKLPEGWVIPDVGGVAVDSRDNVYVFNRGEHPMIVFDREGNFLRSWGEGLFSNRPHAVHMGPDDTIWCTDENHHCVRQCTLGGKVLLTLGTPGQGAPFFSGRPFCRCCHTALSPTGDIYVADGYGNARVHKYAPDGTHLFSWGASGTGPGEFNVAHNIACDADGWVYVADRENHRIQIFDGKGRFETEWTNVHRPAGLFTDNKHFYTGELGPFLPIHRQYPNIGPRVSVLNKDGSVAARIGLPFAGTEPGQFMAPHGLALDSRGDLYVGEVSHSSWGALFPDQPRPAFIRSLQKFVKVT